MIVRGLDVGAVKVNQGRYLEFRFFQIRLPFYRIIILHMLWLVIL